MLTTGLAGQKGIIITSTLSNIVLAAQLPHLNLSPDTSCELYLILSQSIGLINLEDSHQIFIARKCKLVYIILK
jgi:hypothetical protein